MKKPDVTGFKKELAVAWHFLRLTRTIQPSYLPLAIIASLFKALTPFLNIIAPKFILDELMGLQRVDRLIVLVSLVVIGNAAFNLVNRFFETRMDIANVALINGFDLHLGKHIMRMDFENLEDPEILNQKEQALYPMHNQGVMQRMISSSLSLMQTSLTLLGLVAIVSTLNVLLIALIIVILLANAMIMKKSQATLFRFFQGLAPLNRRFEYYIKLITDFSFAKDVRIFNMAPLILNKVDDFSDKNLNGFCKTFNMIGRYSGISTANLQLQMVLVYAYMVRQVFKSVIGIGDFMLYIAAVNSFSTNITTLLAQLIEFRQMCQYLDLYLQFEGIPVKGSRGTKRLATPEDITIEFRHVWFQYPRSQEAILKDVSLTIKSGEKLSIVGQNGAGKTTFIKLLCRLYEPNQGEIMINGVDIKEYDFAAYMQLLSVVFQDFKLFSFSVRENLAMNQPCDPEALDAALRKSGIYDKVQSLSQAADTSLYKNFDEKGTELSGGEMQKLAIARAIYKDAPIVILDEPTAALDPYAEYEIFSRFNELIQNKTAIYISHRLSSCRFCDKIAVFDQGALTEYGTHAELSRAGGKYADMWQAQAQYYVTS